MIKKWSFQLAFGGAVSGIQAVAIRPLEALSRHSLGQCEQGARLGLEGPLPADPDRDCTPIAATLMANGIVLNACCQIRWTAGHQ